MAYGQILSQGVLDIPKIFSINVHASSLPKYRGAAPINWAIINGEETTGITVMKMTKEMDAGPIIQQAMLDISDSDTAITLEDKLSQIGAQTLSDTLGAIENNNYRLVPQDESKVSFAPKLKKEDGLIDWSKSIQDIYNLIRGCAGWPSAFTYYQGKLLKILKVSVSPTPRTCVFPSCGEIMRVSKEGIVVATGGDNLIIEELQIEGKKKMKAEDFISGHRIKPGDRLGYPTPSINK
jgi:methionyl-tRNA formyltransferase